MSNFRVGGNNYGTCPRCGQETNTTVEVHHCAVKDELEEPVFKIRANDQSSVKAVFQWMAENHDAPVGTLQSAFKKAMEMREYQRFYSDTFRVKKAD